MIGIKIYIKYYMVSDSFSFLQEILNLNYFFMYFAYLLEKGVPFNSLSWYKLYGCFPDQHSLNNFHRTDYTTVPFQSF